jgi:hypothetical protein
MMSTPPWWQDLIGGIEVLEAGDQYQVEDWRDDSHTHDDSEDAHEDEDDLPLTIRLAHLGRAFAENVDRLTGSQRRQVLGVLEHVLVDGSEYDKNAVATGFFEALLGRWDNGFDLRSVWADVGPESRAYCLAWNRFTGIESPEWMLPV